MHGQITRRSPTTSSTSSANTPLVRLNRIVPAGAAEVLGKMESLNPAGSVKDRIALDMIEEAEREGQLKPGDTIVEPTSGNTGIGLAMVAAVKGYQLILTMPEDMSVERRDLLARYGAQLMLTPAIEGMTGAVFAAQELLEKNAGYFMPQQFENPANPEVHRRTTARRDPRGDRRPHRRLRRRRRHRRHDHRRRRGAASEKLPDVLIVAVEPARSPVLQGGRPGLHAIQGIGASFVPGVLNREIYDEIIAVERRGRDRRCPPACAREEGLLVGISAGANVWASLKVAKRLGEGKRVVTVLPRHRRALPEQMEA